MDTPHHNPHGPGPPSDPDAPRRRDRPPLRLRELLAEVSKGPTRLELVCWQLNYNEARARPAWDLALRVKLSRRPAPIASPARRRSSRSPIAAAVLCAT
jgi:hypothetical protein